MSDLNEKKTSHISGVYDTEDGLTKEELFSKTVVMESLTDGEEEPKEEPKKKIVKERTALTELLEFLRDLAVCMAAVVVITNFIARPVQVHGSSMYPTLEDSALGFSNILGYKTSGIERFDVVIIYMPEKDEYLVKRCVGLPGETISYKDGVLYVNGEAVEETFFDEEYKNFYEEQGITFMSDVQEITLGEDEYYCLGDNRPHSTDSRYYGPFKAERIRAKGVFVFWPLSQLGAVTW